MSTLDFAFGTGGGASDGSITKTFPGVEFQGTEAAGGWAEIREIQGSLWHVTNATYNEALSGFQQINPLLQSQAFVQTATGNFFYAAAAGAALPIVWSTANSKVTAGSFSSPFNDGILGIYNVRDYGATGNGVTDDTAAFIAANAAVLAASGGTLYVPSGTYLISSMITLSSYCRLMGAGIGNTVIWAAASYTGDVIQVAGVADSTIEGITFNTSSASGTYRAGPGAFIASSGGGTAQNIIVRDCEFANYFVAINIDGTNSFYVQNCKILWGKYGITTGRHHPSADVYIRDCFGQNILSDNTTNPIAWVQVGGTVGTDVSQNTASTSAFTMVDCEWSSGANGMIVDTTNGNVAGSSFVVNSYFDSVETYCLRLSGSTIKPSMWKFTNCWFATSFSTVGVYLNGADTCEFVNCIIANNESCGVLLDTNSKNCKFTSCDILFNNGLGSATITGSGIYVSSAIDTVIEACEFGVNVTWPGARQSYGVGFDPANSTGLLVHGSNFSGGYTVAPYTLLSALTGTAIYQNPVKFTECNGVNPGGAANPAPGVPASGTAITNPFPFDVTIYTVGGTISAASITGAATTANGGTTTTTQTLTLTSGTPIRLCAGERIALTYTGSPAWAWRLD